MKVIYEAAAPTIQFSTVQSRHPEEKAESTNDRLSTAPVRQRDCSSTVFDDFFSLPGFSSHSLSFIPGVIEAQLDTGAAGGVNAERLVTPSSSSYAQTN